MNTEQDTFDALRRTPIDEVAEEIIKAYDDKDGHNVILMNEILAKHGWTPRAYVLAGSINVHRR